LFLLSSQLYLKIFMKTGYLDGETMGEQVYQSGYDQSVDIFFFLRFVIILFIEQDLHSYEYEDGFIPFPFL